MGNWMGWNFGRSGSRGTGQASYDYVIVDVTVVGEGPIEGTYVGDITVKDRTKGGIVVREQHIDAATLAELRERAERMGASENGQAGRAYRDRQWERRNRGSGAQDGLTISRDTGEFHDPTGMGGE